MVVKEKYKCAVCGHEDDFEELISMSSFGSCDLDTRPPEMERSSLPQQIKMCKKCGYVNFEINILPYRNIPKLIQTQDYQMILKKNIDENVKAYELLAFIFEHNADYEGAAFSFLKAAWLCDDLFDNQNAIVFRKKSLDLFLKVLTIEDNDTYKTIIMDLYRRIGDFHNCIKFQRTITFSEDLPLLTIIRYFELLLAASRDDKCHTIEEAEKCAQIMNNSDIIK